jgi:hypothetical protein
VVEKQIPAALFWWRPEADYRERPGLLISLERSIQWGPTLSRCLRKQAAVRYRVPVEDQDDSRLILSKSGNKRALSATSSPSLRTTQQRPALNRNSAHRKSQRVGTRSRASPTHSLQNEGWGTLCPGGSRRSRTKGWATLPESQSGEVHYEIKMEALHYSFSGIRPTCLVGDSAAICATRSWQ